MAIAGTQVVAGGDTTPGTSNPTASWTPTANVLILLDVRASNNGGSAPAAPSSVTGNGLTWVQDSTVTYTDSATETARLTRFRTMGASPTTGATTINQASAPTASMSWTIREYSGTDTTGTNGSGAVVQTVTNTGTGTAVSASMAAWGDTTNNAADLGVVAITSPTISPEAGWTAYTQQTDFGTMRNMWRIGQDTTPTATLSASDAWAAMATEIKASGGGGGPSAGAKRYYRINHLLTE